MSPDLKKVLSLGIEAVLIPAGFEHVGRRQWRRSTEQLEHVIEVLQRRGTYDVQWGVVSPELVWFLWGTEPRGDVGDAALTGWPSGIKHPSNAQSFRLDGDSDPDAIAVGLAEDMQVVEAWLRPFQTRADLRGYLLVNRDQNDPRGFVFPKSLSLKLYVAAALAVVDRAPDARDLVTEAEVQSTDFQDPLNRARSDRLTEALGSQG